eukprot:gene1952-1460_t
MKYFEKVELSSSGRPQLIEDEIECLTVTNLNIEDSKGKSFKNSKITITTHRLLYLDLKDPKGTSLENIQNIEKHSPLFFGSTKVHIIFKDELLKLSFGDKKHDLFHETLEIQLKKKSWLVKKKVEKKTFSTTSAGITGISRTVKSQEETESKTLKEAFKDIDSLMVNAKELVELAGKFSEKVKKGDKLSKEDTKVKDFLITMGITSPVTKQATGTLYHEELAKQLSDYLPKHLEKNGMIALTDAFCLYNRARGTDLISPEDMYRACSLFDQLDLNLTLKKFDSGVIVIQSKKYNLQQVSKTLSKLIEEKGSLTSVELSQEMGISIILAKEQLIATESMDFI